MHEHHPPPGTYYIVNEETSPDGESLAVTFNGLYVPMNVTELDKLPTQAWVISDESNGLQGISPQDGLGLYIIPGDNHNLMPWAAGPAGYVWSIERHAGTYTIRTKDPERLWNINEAKAGEAVTWQSGTDAKNYHWKLVPVGS